MSGNNNTYHSYFIQPNVMKPCPQTPPANYPNCAYQPSSSKPSNYAVAGYITSDNNNVNFLPCDDACLSHDISEFEDSYSDFTPQTQKAFSDLGGKCSTNLNSKVFQKCIYDGAAFNKGTYADVVNYRTFNALNGDRNYDEIMTQFCAGRVSDGCPGDPLNDGLKPSFCPRFFSSSSEGQECTKWITSKKDVPTKAAYTDAIASIYCSQYPYEQTCACVNRGLSGIGGAKNWPYYQLKQNAPYNDGCWYSPCMPNIGTDQYYFQPSDVNVNVNPSQQCPKNICLNFINSTGYNNMYFNNNTIYTNCGSTSNPNGNT
jgi:hypothetical protein